MYIVVENCHHVVEKGGGGKEETTFLLTAVECPHCLIFLGQIILCCTNRTIDYHWILQSVINPEGLRQET